MAAPRKKALISHGTAAQNRRARYDYKIGDTIEAGTTRLPDSLRERLRHTVEATDGGNMMRAMAFADDEAIIRWGDRLDIDRLRDVSVSKPPLDLTGSAGL